MMHKLAQTRPGWILSLWLLLLFGCSGQPETGPVKIRWDRDSCERCRMVLSDPHFAAQIRYFPAGSRSRVAKFDDIGCAVLWLQGKSWEDDERTEIWVADYHSGEWLDARAASYIGGRNTPMAYGLGALPEKVAGSMNYAEAKAHIGTTEQQHHHQGTSR